MICINDWCGEDLSARAAAMQAFLINLRQIQIPTLLGIKHTPHNVWAGYSDAPPLPQTHTHPAWNWEPDKQGHGKVETDSDHITHRMRIAL